MSAVSEGAIFSPQRKIRSGNPLVIAARRSVRQPIGLATMAIIAILVLLAIAAPLISPHDPLIMYQGEELKAPTLNHPFGTDEYGRDLMSRILYGLRISLVAGILSVLIGAASGIMIGLLTGYLGGKVDAVMMRVIDGMMAFPPILLGIAMVAAFGPGLTNLTFIIAVMQIAGFARLSRSTTLAEKNRDYVMAAVSMGASTKRILAQHILLNSVGPLLVAFALSTGFSVLVEASLSFLGLGINPPTPSLGSILFAAQSKMRHAVWYPIFPGLFLSLLLFALNGLADALNDAFTPTRKI